MCFLVELTMSETPKQYLARIGAKGGKKSRRKLSTQEASQTARARWGKPEKKPATPKPKAHPQPAQITISESEAAILARLNNHQLKTKTK